MCDFLKVDCEGCEYDVLLNSDPDVLSRVKRISAETHSNDKAHTAEELAAFLESNGFVVNCRENPVHEYLGFLYAERLD